MTKQVNDKKTNGVVYTPEWVVQLMLSHINFQNKNGEYKLIDPACGDGAFLVPIVKKTVQKLIKAGWIKSEIKEFIKRNIYGFDINENTVSLCKINLNNVMAEYDIPDIEWNIYHIDSLDKELVYPYFGSFDLVIGNPPYVRIQHLGESRRKSLQAEWNMCEKGSTDMYLAFFELGYNLLKEDGELIYITPNSYLKSKAGLSFRNYLLQKKILKSVINFEEYQVFPNATTYSAITQIVKNHNSYLFEFYKGEDKSYSYIDTLDLNELNIHNWILKEKAIINKINQIERRGKNLGEIANIHTGITTLADKLYIFTNPRFEGDFAYINIDNTEILLEKDILKPIIKASILKSSDEVQNRYIIFPYKKNGAGKHVIIPEDEMMSLYPHTYRYFLSKQEELLARDKGKKNTVAWYAFGRQQGLDTSFGKKILTSPINLKPNFIPISEENSTFYAGYCIKYDGDLDELSHKLNSDDMNFYIQNTSRDYQNKYKSYSKSFIQNFGIE